MCPSPHHPPALDYWHREATVLEQKMTLAELKRQQEVERRLVILKRRFPNAPEALGYDDRDLTVEGVAFGRLADRQTHTCISLGDIHNLPTFWVLALFGSFCNFCFRVQTCRHRGGGMCILFEICMKTPFQKCMGWGGGA